MPVKTKDQLKAELNTTFFENPGGGITPALVQTFMIDIIDSYQDFDSATVPNYAFGQGNAAGSGSATGVGVALTLADWFVDSIAGSDSNAGTSQAAPFATLAKAGTSITANPTKTAVALKRGSLFRESLPASVVTCIDYGTSGSPPIIDGSDIITGWTVNGTQASVWEKTLTIDTGGRPRIYEDGSLMPWVADLATCAATAGSRVLLNNGGTITLQMHPTGGGNPNTNGKSYEATSRASPILMGDNCVLKGIHARRAVINDGAISVGENAYVERCISSDGSKHNMLINSGTIIDTILVRADAVTPTEASSTWLVGFDGRGVSGQSITLRRVGFCPDGSDGSPAFICHDVSGGAYASVTAEQIWMLGSGAFAPAADVLNVQGYFADQCLTPVGGGTMAQMTVDCFQVKNTGFDSDTGLKSFAVETNLTPQTLTLSNGALYCEGGNNAWFRLQSAMNGYVVSLQNTAWATSLGSSRTSLVDEGWTVGSISVNGNILHSSPFGTYINIPVTYTGNDNVFAKQDGGAGGTMIYQGTTYHGIAQWQTGVGQDANSFDFEGQFVGQLFSGTYSAGDYRLAGTGIGASAASINAGPQFHWDWNTRTKVSGPPTSWPNPPRTLGDAITYATNPNGWTW